jgi:hypothetical protein
MEEKKLRERCSDIEGRWEEDEDGRILLKKAAMSLVLK